MDKELETNLLTAARARSDAADAMQSTLAAHIAAQEAHAAADLAVREAEAAMLADYKADKAAEAEAAVQPE